MDSRIFDRDYWHDLRSRTSVRGIGYNQCDDWSRESIDLLVKDGRPERFVMYETLRHMSPELAKRGWFHCWIETATPQGRFVADGTAGQMDGSFTDGFYGFLDQASPILRDIYLNGYPTC